MEIRKTTEPDVEDVLNVHVKAFGLNKGAEISDLVHGLLNDPTALPLLSLIATKDNHVVGHILFTKAHIENGGSSVSAVILAPLAVVPEAQSQGVGGQLIREGLKLLAKLGVELVFVLGHPEYYPRYGFKPAGVQGFEAPYPIPENHANAWMVQELQSGVIGAIKGKVRCSEALDQPEHWPE